VRVSFKIARKSAIAADPGQAASSTFRQHDEFVQFVALDDLEEPTTSAGSRSRAARLLIAGIGEDALNEGPRRRQFNFARRRCWR